MGGTPSGQGRWRVALGRPTSLERHLWLSYQGMNNMEVGEEEKMSRLVGSWVGTPDSGRNFRHLSKLLTWVRTPDVGQNSSLRLELPTFRWDFPTMEHLLEVITSSSGHQIRHSIYVFGPSWWEEHNGEILSTFLTTSQNEQFWLSTETDHMALWQGWLGTHLCPINPLMRPIK